MAKITETRLDYLDRYRDQTEVVLRHLLATKKEIDDHVKHCPCNLMVHNKNVVSDIIDSIDMMSTTLEVIGKRNNEHNKKNRTDD